MHCDCPLFYPFPSSLPRAPRAQYDHAIVISGPEVYQASEVDVMCMHCCMQWNWACIAIKHVETKTEEAVNFGIKKWEIDLLSLGENIDSLLCSEFEWIRYSCFYVNMMLLNFAPNPWQVHAERFSYQKTLNHADWACATNECLRRTKWTMKSPYVFCFPLCFSFFKVENNSLELTRIFKESFRDQRWAWEESVSCVFHSFSFNDKTQTQTQNA